MTIERVLLPVGLLLLHLYAATSVVLMASGVPNPMLAALLLIGIPLVLFGLLIALVVYVPVLIVVARGLWPEFGSEPTGPFEAWRWVFSSRETIDRDCAYRAIRHAHPLPPTDLYYAFGKDTRRIFEAVGRAATAKGDKYRITGWLTSIRDADFDDYDQLIGYLGAANPDAAIYAARENMPIDYAKAMFP